MVKLFFCHPTHEEGKNNHGSLPKSLMASSPLTPIPLLNIAPRTTKPHKIPASLDVHVENSVPLLSAAGIAAAARQLCDVALGALYKVCQ